MNYTFRLVRQLDNGKVHILVDDPDNPLEVTLCGLTNDMDWPGLDILAGPPWMSQMCRMCCRQLGWLADNSVGYWPTYGDAL